MKRSFFKIFVGIFILATLNSCAYLKHYKKGLNAFNEASTINNAKRLGGSTGSQTLEHASYSLALLEMTKALRAEDKLSSVGLLETSLVIKALSEWKLGHFDKANGTAKKAILVLEKSPKPLLRDATVMRVMPALIKAEKLDLLLDTLSSTGSKSGDEKLFGDVLVTNFKFELMFSPVDQELQTLKSANSHEALQTKLYLLEVGFSILANWNTVEVRYLRGTKYKAEYHTKVANKVKLYKEEMNVLNKKMNGKLSSRIARWEERLPY